MLKRRKNSKKIGVEGDKIDMRTLRMSSNWERRGGQ